MAQAVAYYRVSTRAQGRSALGLDAQRAAVACFAEGQGITFIAEFLETESGKGADALARRPQLRAAIRASGVTSLGGIANALNARGIPTARGAGAGTSPRSGTPSGGKVGRERPYRRTLPFAASRSRP